MLLDALGDFYPRLGQLLQLVAGDCQLLEVLGVDLTLAAFLNGYKVEVG